MKNLPRILLLVAILCSLGANWDMSGTKTRWNMVGSEAPELPELPELPEPTIDPTLAPIQDTKPVMITRINVAPKADPLSSNLVSLNSPTTSAAPLAPLALPELPTFEEIKSTQPVTKTCPNCRRARLLRRRR